MFCILLVDVPYRAHILERGISPVTVMDFQLGYSPADLTSPLVEYLVQVGERFLLSSAPPPISPSQHVFIFTKLLGDTVIAHLPP